MKLTDPMIEALGVLHHCWRRWGENSWTGMSKAQVVKALVRRGLAEMRRRTFIRRYTEYRITKAGIQAWEDLQ